MHFHQALLPWPLLCSTYRSGKFQRNGEMHAMTMDKFTTKAQEALANAQLMAQAGQPGEIKNPITSPGHLAGERKDPITSPGGWPCPG